MRAWGYEYRTNMVEQYSPDEMSPGYLLRGEHGMVMVGKRGEYPGPVAGTQPLTIISALSEDGEIRDRTERLRVLQAHLDAMYPEASKLELFTGARRAGWASWGETNALVTPDALGV
jgi:N6-adenosine-specific RNA methylase IME4